MTQPPKFGAARDIWEMCPECGGSLRHDRASWQCTSCEYSTGADR